MSFPPVNQGDIVLITYPFTDLKKTKKRPALVISNQSKHTISDDIICFPISSNNLSALGIIINSTDLISGSLPRQSLIKTDKIYTLHKKLIITIFGKVSDKIIETTITEFNKVIAKK